MSETAGGLPGERGTANPPANDDISPHMWARLVAWLSSVRLFALTRHRHALVPVKVTNPPAGMSALLGGTPPPVGTIVLLRCDCGQGTGHLAEIMLRGRYTLPQVQGLPSWAEEPATEEQAA